MYVPAHFADNSAVSHHELIRNNPLGTLVTYGQNGLDANHLPFLLDVAEESLGRLHCHVSRANPVLRDVSTNDEVLVIFRGPSGYVSPNWYPSKQETGRQVPTWNYRTVHAHGRAIIRDDDRYVRTVVAKLTKTHEANSAQPWKMSDGPREYIDELLKQIVGIEIEIRSFEGKAKLGQDDGVSDMRGAAEGLRTKGEVELADAIAIAATNLSLRSE
ncbi:FMN-binding negative transcriptional regulator [Rhizobium giardinii]|uniref:FMN-binding negative transcriptional regulator n=1 Tax=Rhizobium giardinii TaxID=56731 RepID=UPI000375E2BF|nr:FMN-binding negative transcriptional regulator [Rhizobium giardinii]